MEIQTLRYIDFYDLTEEAQEAFQEFVRASGHSSGTPWLVQVGEQDSTIASWIGQEKMEKINECLRAVLKDGETINIIWEW